MDLLLAVVMVAVFGTMGCRCDTRGLGIPYLVSTVFFAVVLALSSLCVRERENTVYP